MLKRDGAINELCLNCEKPDCSGICDELRATMGEIASGRQGKTITWHGITRTLSEWAEVLGMTRQALYKRLNGQSDIDTIMASIQTSKTKYDLPPGSMEETYVRLSTMHLDYVVFWKRLIISEGSSGMVARYGVVQSAPTGKISDPVARRAMPELTLSDEALHRRAWVACVLHILDCYRASESDQPYSGDALKARLLERRAIQGDTMRRICNDINAEDPYAKRPMTLLKLRKYFEKIVVDVTREALRRGLIRTTQK